LRTTRRICRYQRNAIDEIKVRKQSSVYDIARCGLTTRNSSQYSYNTNFFRPFKSGITFDTKRHGFRSVRSQTLLLVRQILFSFCSFVDTLIRNRVIYYSNVELFSNDLKRSSHLYIGTRVRRIIMYLITIYITSIEFGITFRTASQYDFKKNDYAYLFLIGKTQNNNN